MTEELTQHNDNLAGGSGDRTHSQEGLDAKVPEFTELAADSEQTGAKPSLEQVLDVRITLTAELGRTVLPLRELLKVGVGSVIELDRSVSEPVDIVAQGVKLARGEVVVVNDKFAIRIKEIVDPKKKDA